MKSFHFLLPLCLALPLPGGEAVDSPPAANPAAPGLRLPMWRGRALIPVAAGPALELNEAMTAVERRRKILGQIIAPPSDWLAMAGVTSGWPDESRLIEIREAGDSLILRLALPDAFLLGGGVTDEWLEDASRQLLAALQELPAPPRLHLAVRDPRKPQRPWIALSAFLPPFDPATIVKERVAEPVSAVPPSPSPLVRRVRPAAAEAGTVTAGALSGRQIFLSQCHGWIDYNTADAWETQRGITNGIVEDFVDPEGANAYLLRYLENAGATVWTLREADSNTNMVIVDSADGSAFPANGAYVESGSPPVFANSPNDSFGNFSAPYTSTEDPLRKTGNKDRLITVSTSETARATWTPNFRAVGFF